MIDSLQWWALVAVAAGTALVVGALSTALVELHFSSLVGFGTFIAVAGWLTFWFLSVAEDVDV
ncbi:MAG: hypothetical protein F4237_11370 [Gemmatimonadetes bacterium]|nr:hypothetical protein [Gemmatimonadota bacterium]